MVDQGLRHLNLLVPVSREGPRLGSEHMVHPAALANRDMLRLREQREEARHRERPEERPEEQPEKRPEERPEERHDEPVEEPT